MAFKFVILSVAFAVANAGFIGAPATYAAGPVIGSPAITYSPAPAVSHISYSSPIVSYGTPIAAQTPAITSKSANILRSYGNLGQISTYSKTIDTPFSSVRKSDVRVSNPGFKIATATPLAYAAPAIHAQYAAPTIHQYAAPAIHQYAAPAIHAQYAAPAVHAPAAIGVAYSAAPAVSHVTYQGVAASYGW